MPWSDPSQITVIASCFPAAPRYPADILDLHAPGDRRRRGDPVGDSGPDATSPAESYPGDKPAGPGGGISAPGNHHRTQYSRPIRFALSGKVPWRRPRLKCHGYATVITVNKPRPINSCLYLLLQVEVCRSQHTNGWLSALYVYKGLLLVVGVYMAWETR